MSKDIASILDAAADLLEKPGAWMQEDYSDSLGFGAGDLQDASCWCISGAIGAVGGMSATAAEEWANKHFMSLIGIDHIGGAPGWNDEEGRTQSEVVAKLREAASKARGQS